MTALELMQSLRLQGHTLKEIANYLNQEGYLSMRGKPFNKDSVHLYLKRLGLTIKGLVTEQKKIPQEKI